MWLFDITLTLHLLLLYSNLPLLQLISQVASIDTLLDGIVQLGNDIVRGSVERKEPHCVALGVPETSDVGQERAALTLNRGLVPLQALPDSDVPRSACDACPVASGEAGGQVQVDRNVYWAAVAAGAIAVYLQLDIDV